MIRNIILTVTLAMSRVGESILINDLVLKYLGGGCTKVLGGRTTAAALRQVTASHVRRIAT